MLPNKTPVTVRPLFLLGLGLYILGFQVFPYAMGALGVATDNDWILTHWLLSPVAAVCLYCGAGISNRAVATALPLGTLLLCDLLIALCSGKWEYGFYGWTQVVVYACQWLKVELGRTFVRPRLTIARALGVGLLGEVIFFFATNTANWIFFDTFPHTPAGLMSCYVSAIPYARPLFLAQFVFIPILFSPLGLRQLGLEPAERAADTLSAEPVAARA